MDIQIPHKMGLQIFQKSEKPRIAGNQMSIFLKVCQECVLNILDAPLLVNSFPPFSNTVDLRLDFGLIYVTYISI